MCQVSDKIKFCTCGAEEAKELKDYWVLHRPADKRYPILGKRILPKAIDKNTDLLNRENLLRRINEPDAFDITEKPLEDDKLVLCFTYGQQKDEFIKYTYRFTNGQWHEQRFGAFELTNTCNWLAIGKIESTDTI